MRFDHLTVHIDNDPGKLQALKDTAGLLGYPFNPDNGKKSAEFHSANINIGDEYVEIVRLLRPKARSWVPAWTRAYDAGQRGAFCLFLELPDVERTAVALKKAGVQVNGPATLTYPAFTGILRANSPYFLYYLPSFPYSVLQIALMQYKDPRGRENFLAGLVPNAQEFGFNGIRRVEVELPDLDASMDLLQKVFEDLHLENGKWMSLLEKTRIAFSPSEDGLAHLRLHIVTSKRENIGKRFQVENVEIITTGG